MNLFGRAALSFYPRYLSRKCICIFSLFSLRPLSLLESSIRTSVAPIIESFPFDVLKSTFLDSNALLSPNLFTVLLVCSLFLNFGFR